MPNGHPGIFFGHDFDDIDFRVPDTIFAQILLIWSIGKENTDNEKNRHISDISCTFRLFLPSQGKKTISTNYILKCAHKKHELRDLLVRKAPTIFFAHFFIRWLFT